LAGAQEYYLRAQEHFLPLGAECPIAYRTTPPQIEGLNAFEEDLYAMSTAANHARRNHFQTEVPRLEF